MRQTPEYDCRNTVVVLKRKAISNSNSKEHNHSIVLLLFQEIDTALLKLYAECNHDKLMEFVSKENSCYFDDSVVCLKQYKVAFVRIFLALLLSEASLWGGGGMLHPLASGTSARHFVLTNLAVENLCQSLINKCSIGDDAPGSKIRPCIFRG